jgi:hypothetical protein
MIEILIPANTARSWRRRTFSRLGALAALVLPLSLLIQGIAVAASPSKIVWNSTGGEPNAGLPQFWTGTVYSDDMRNPDVRECRNVSCDHLLLKVNLPTNLWQGRPGGLQIAFRFIFQPDSTSGGFDHFKQGMSVGWADTYNWFLPVSTWRLPVLSTAITSSTPPWIPLTA